MSERDRMPARSAVAVGCAIQEIRFAVATLRKNPAQASRSDRAALLLISVATLISFLRAHSASRVDPITALPNE